ncbi:glycosyltransferase family 4 protein [Methanomicrobium antiquum]|uniref:Glycosyltransferase family 4 protein n=2 Tax=Methanomicrobium antiquum TaxID=487686 RepID=A0AAF0JNA0_9EURY|nr:glycosyltransferase family 4 protein [Methanomicrobium antiquum]WFN37947.1 glycosyltransferase family 4 protein [Methanomicrobium antiquum]
MVDSLEEKNVKVIKAVKKSASPFAYSTFYLDSFVNSLKKDVDIFQAEYIPHSSIIPALMKSKKPLILKFHGDDGLIYPYKNHFNRALFNLSVNRADHIITCSEALKTSLINLGVESEKITPIANGVDTSVFKPMNKEHCRESFSLDKNATICLYAGRIHPMKGIFDLIEAAKLNPDVTFIFGGPGPVPKHPSNCFFLGDISPEKMPILMNAADFLVLPSHSEGLGLVLLESLACGVPVIASNVGGCPEIITNKDSGILIPPKNIKYLSKAIKYYDENFNLRNKTGKTGREYVLENYDNEKLNKKLMSIHLKLINL